MAPKTCLLHIGTHKTGTTSFQALIAENREQFRNQGLFYPVTGRIYYGHHNLAWELSGDHRFAPGAGSLAQLADELECTRASSVLLSSEDFECLYRRPNALLRIWETLGAAGYTTLVVMTLRQPSEYVQSLYTELVWQGLRSNLATFVRRALSDGRIAFRQWDFCFDYSRLSSTFARVFGESHVRVLRYEPDDSVGPLLTVCGSLLGLSLHSIPNQERLNNREARRDHSEEPEDPVSADVLTASERDALDATFGKGLDDALSRYGAQPRNRIGVS